MVQNKLPAIIAIALNVLDKVLQLIAKKKKQKEFGDKEKDK